jgi:hypothetical protein
VKRRAECFEDVFNKKEPYTVLDAGLRVIEVSKVVGTVDKCGELDQAFRYIKRKDRGELSRWNRIRDAARRYDFFPLIDVNFYKGKYYVVDGNRRVAAAKALEMEFIDADVKEYIPGGDKEMLSGALYRRRFESEMGLKNIRLTSEIGYRLLLEEIESSAGTGKAERAQQWYSTCYLPFCAQIGRSEIQSFYPGLSEGDIFVLIVGFYRDFIEVRCNDKNISGVQGISFRTLISGFMFAHRIPERRLFRGFPFRMLNRLVLPGEKKTSEL